MKAHDVFTRRQFLATSAAGAVVLASSNKAVAQATQAQKFHVKALPGEICINHGINQE